MNELKSRVSDVRRVFANAHLSQLCDISCVTQTFFIVVTNLKSCQNLVSIHISYPLRTCLPEATIPRGYTKQSHLIDRWERFLQRIEHSYGFIS